MIETLSVDKWLVQRLTGGASGLPGGDLPGVGVSVWEGVIPQGAAFPCVLFAYITDTEVVGSDATRLLVEPLYKVVAVGEGNDDTPLVPIVNAMDALLQTPDAPELVDGVYVRGAYREHVLKQTEEPAATGQVYRHIGGLYRIHCWGES